MNSIDQSATTKTVREPLFVQRRAAGVLLIAGPAIFLLIEFVVAAASTDNLWILLLAGGIL